MDWDTVQLEETNRLIQEEVSNALLVQERLDLNTQFEKLERMFCKR